MPGPAYPLIECLATDLILILERERLKKMIENGRVCIKTAGRDAGKICIVVEKIDENFVIADGETRRRKVNVRHLEPLDKAFELKSGDHDEVKKIFESELQMTIVDAKSKESKERPRRVRKSSQKDSDAKPKKVKKAAKKTAGKDKAAPKKASEDSKSAPKTAAKSDKKESA